MQRSRFAAPLALGLCLTASAVVAATAPPTPFDGAYKGSMTLGALGLPNSGYTNPPCENHRPAEMSIRGGYVLMWYQDWHRHTLHYKGRIDAAGRVNAYHRNRDGSSSVMTGRVSGNQFTADMRRGRCQYSLELNKK